MGELTLVHDPERGCVGCPVYDDSIDMCQPARRWVPWECDGKPAPDWCPLRRGPVVVRVPEGGDGG